jgi:glycosyltransferase involved in cell wall biosynthesis
MILQQINPRLEKEKIGYKIIICGKNLPANYNELKDFTSQNIIYAGFVDDINLYFKGADIFINPVTDGGGIKTKLVEALSYGLSVVSTVSGAIGIPSSEASNKMLQVKDGNWDDFTEAIVKIDPAEKTPTAFFDHFYWGNIAERVRSILTQPTKR